VVTATAGAGVGAGATIFFGAGGTAFADATTAGLAAAGGTTVIIAESPFAVSRSAASGGRYAPMESTRVVSRFASARSDASAESAAISSRVLEGVPLSQDAANTATPASTTARNALDLIIILDSGSVVELSDARNSML
jgi:hypothetical protein